MNPAAYYKERFNYETIDGEWGFVAYSIVHPYLAIQEVYIAPEKRKSFKFHELFCELGKRAKEAGCSQFWTQVWTNYADASKSLRLSLGLGFQVIEADNGRIILTREIGG